MCKSAVYKKKEPYKEGCKRERKEQIAGNFLKLNGVLLLLVYNNQNNFIFLIK
jgi:hypothetical protein